MKQFKLLTFPHYVFWTIFVSNVPYPVEVRSFGGMSEFFLFVPQETLKRKEAEQEKRLEMAAWLVDLLESYYFDKNMWFWRMILSIQRHTLDHNTQTLISYFHLFFKLKRKIKEFEINYLVYMCVILVFFTTTAWYPAS